MEWNLGGLDCLGGRGAAKQTSTIPENMYKKLTYPPFNLLPHLSYVGLDVGSSVPPLMMR